MSLLYQQNKLQHGFMGKNLHPINSAPLNKITEFTLTRLAPPPPFLAPLLSRDHLPRHHFLKVLKKVLCSHAMTWKEGHFWSIDLTNVNWTTLGQSVLQVVSAEVLKLLF